MYSDGRKIANLQQFPNDFKIQLEGVATTASPKTVALEWANWSV